MEIALPIVGAIIGLLLVISHPRLRYVPCFTSRNARMGVLVAIGAGIFVGILR